VDGIKSKISSLRLMTVLALGFVAVTLLAPISPAKSQSSNEIVRIENDYRECLYAKAKDGRYAKRERDSDFGLLGECRNQWVAYMDLCAKSEFENRMCIVKSRLLIHAILNLTGK